ncbi:hypothetical protein RTCIAT899_CH15215 [Rhizobium tropici CIAT 899]|nr:hypothetical protein RTCIAT899_CH15215 [Rhizobium tropici CIAT 899]
MRILLLHCTNVKHFIAVQNIWANSKILPDPQALRPARHQAVCFPV